MSISIIEMFSVELWREIFDYFHLNDLWYSFYGLNKYINEIIGQTELHLNFENEDKYNYFSENILSCINISNIRSLKLRSAFEIHDFFSIYSLNSLERLEFLSLNFRYYDDETGFPFWNQLSSLKSLKSLKSLEIIHRQRYLYDYNYEEKNFIFNSIFNENCCSSLKSLIIKTNGRYNTSSIPFLITTSLIEYLSINISDFEDFTKLSIVLQYVKFFHIDFELSPNQNSDKQLKNMMNSTLSMPNCIHLHLGLSPHMSFKHIEYLLKQTQNLQYLMLSGGKQLLKAKRWEKLLSINCPKLLKFKFICANFIYDEDYQYDFLHLLDTFEEQCETPYWMERNFTTSYLKLPFSDDDYRRDIIIQFNRNKTIN